jgi:catechol 2,3-dioxygenase-like lactoylglutathione lyase family enzyme
MSTTQVSSERADMKLEVVVLAVADVERSKRFYGSTLGWRLDADFVVGERFRAIQFTPPGSPCSIHFGMGITSAAPGSAAGMWLAVTDIVATRADLIDRGVEVGEIFHLPSPGQPPQKGPHPQRQTYSSFATFRDPDGNQWLLQEVTARLPGRVDAHVVTFNSASELAAAFRRTSEAHGEHEKRNPGKKHDDWPEWYSEHLFAEQLGRPLPT